MKPYAICRCFLILYIPQRGHQDMRLNKNNHFSLMETINRELYSENSKKKIIESWWNTPSLTKRDADQLINQIEKVYNKGGLKGIWDHPQTGEKMSLWELIQGLPEFLYTESPNMISYVLSSVRKILSVADVHDPKLSGVFESVEEDAIKETEEDDINDVKDREIADIIIRYNQVVNRALRARFTSKTRRKSL